MDSQESTLQQGTVDDEQKKAEPVSEVQNIKSEPATEEPAEDKEEAPEKAAETATEEPATEESATKESATEEPAEDKEETHEKATETTTEAEKKVYASKQEVLDRIKEIASNEDNPDKQELDTLKSLFYRFHVAEREQHQKEYLEAGGDPEKYQFVPDEAEDTFKAEMQIIKEKRAKRFQEKEAEKAENLKRKLEIIEKIKGMATSPDEANKSFNEFKILQQEFKDIKAVPAEKANEVWRNYQLYVEQFYDLLNLNREAREYDFKKNLEMKTKLCEEAEKLDAEPDVISAFHQLQDLHSRYREIGPVAKELREEIWARFKAASTVINKKHQQHFEDLRAKEKENLAKKTELCEKAEALAKEENNNASDWEKHAHERSVRRKCGEEEGLGRASTGAERLDGLESDERQIDCTTKRMEDDRHRT